MGADKSLKHLGFVQTYATVYAGVAEKMYKTAKSYTPKFVEPYVAKAEDVVVARAAPLMTSAQDTTGKLLSFADAKVSERRRQADGAVRPGRPTTPPRGAVRSGSLPRESPAVPSITAH